MLAATTWECGLSSMTSVGGKIGWKNGIQQWADCAGLMRRPCWDSDVKATAWCLIDVRREPCRGVGKRSQTLGSLWMVGTRMDGGTAHGRWDRGTRRAGESTGPDVPPTLQLTVSPTHVMGDGPPPARGDAARRTVDKRPSGDSFCWPRRPRANSQVRCRGELAIWRMLAVCWPILNSTSRRARLLSGDATAHSFTCKGNAHHIITNFPPPWILEGE